MKGARKRTDTEGDTSSKKPRPNEAPRDQVGDALRKIRCYVGVPAKFNKAARLLLHLCQDGHMTAPYSDLFFEILALSMLDREVCMKAEYRKGYCKLISSALEMASLLSPLLRKQLEVYQMWTIGRNELSTDDSFLFNKNMSKLKELALQLPTSTDRDEHTFHAWKEKTEKARVYYREHRRELEDDALCIDWSEEECLAARREAIVDWLEASKAVYRHQWACTAIDIAIHTLSENKDKFCQEQKDRIVALMRFSRDQKMKRQQGPSAKETRRDTTSFEKARSEWSKAEVSNRGMVGASGDHKHEAWLG